MRPLRSQDGLIPSPPPEDIGTYNSIHNHQTCPVEEESRPQTPASEQSRDSPEIPLVDCIDGQPTQQATPPPEAEIASETQSANACDSPSGKTMPMEDPDDGPIRESPPPPERSAHSLYIYASDNDQKQLSNSPTTAAHVSQSQLPIISPWPRTRVSDPVMRYTLRPTDATR